MITLSVEKVPWVGKKLAGIREICKSGTDFILAR
jgi:hypothetical protein